MKRVGNAMTNIKSTVKSAFTTDYAPKFENTDVVNTVTVKMTGNEEKGYVIDDVNVGDKKTIELQELTKMDGKELVFRDGKTNRGAIEKALGSSSSNDIAVDPQNDNNADTQDNNNGTSGGYAAMKRSRSVGTKRKTMRQAKRHARRSRRSRISL
jgi:hypothetical protein